VVAAAAATALVIAGVAFWFFRQERASPAGAAERYLDAWERSDFEAMEALLFREVKDFRGVHERLAGELGAGGVSFELGDVTEDGESARADLGVTWDLKAAGRWQYRSALELEFREDRWLVVWSPATIHPKSKTTAGFRRTRSWPDRGRILAADGKPIVEQRPVVVVGVEPRRIRDRAALVQALVDNLGSDPAKINAALDQPGLRGDWFLPVEELTVERYEQVKPAIYPVPGLVFQNRQKRMPPSPGFARHVVGTVGEVTKEGLEKLGEPYEASDQVGLTGLEGVFEKTLAGRPAIEISVERSGGSGEVLHRVEGATAQDITTTLSVEAQAAAEAALESTLNPAAIVVVDVPSAEIRAVVSRPLEQFNRAMSGRYPPGSSFKVVTTAALLASGVAADAAVECPAEIEVGGRTFKNFESEALGKTTFKQAFVHSCNTAFIGLATPLGERLGQSAATFGFGARYDLPLNAASGSFPEPRDDTERAAAAIGQGRVLASPLHMASVAAAIPARGWRPPTLLTETPEVNRNPLEPATAQTLDSLMQAVVSEGTGARSRVPGKQLAGKTGTAEFGKEVPPKTHAWFVGYSGSHAFAVLIEDGGVGGEVAAPIAAKLVAALG
jgi:cell division protein FtsI/penicillin-binding protein 2